ncbi:MAG: beta-L-arabinofuranosidase domain-containing protein [Verrucomicrobiia bacterium]
MRHIMVAVILALASATNAADLKTSEVVNYARPFEPPTRPAFIALPPGAVEPAGWLRDWALSVKDGYTEHMDDVDDEFKRAWTPDFKPTGEKLAWHRGSWSFEGGGYWFDGLVQLGFALKDDALLQQAKRRLYAVADNMNTTNGILFLPWLDRNDPENWKALYAANEGFPLGTSGLLGGALFQYFAATGDQHVLSALEKAYATDPAALLRAKHRTTNLFPAYNTYVWSGNPGIAAALDTMFKDGCTGTLPQRSREFSTLPGAGPNRTVANAHGVMFLRHLTPWMVGYLWTGNSNYLSAVLAWDEWINRVAMQPYGVPVADEWYHPTGAFRGTETCDVAMYIESQRDLLLVTGDGKMADRIERAFFNAAPAVLSRDCKTHVYFQSPNRFAAGAPTFPDGPRGSGCDYKRKHNPLCCTAALNRILPDYLSNMWMATRDNGLAVVCYGPCQVTARVANHVSVCVSCTTDYPFEETIRMTVRPAQTATFPIHFHVPGWCAKPEIAINGAECKAVTGHGFLRVDREWRKGDQVRLLFPMTAKVEKRRDTSLELAKSPTHRPVQVGIPEPDGPGKPYATVSYGPLLCALPIPDTKDANTPDPNARWRFALDVEDLEPAIERTPMPARWDWPLAAPVSLSVRAVPIDWAPTAGNPLLPEAAVAERGPAERIRLVPYGCTKFRVSMFPVAAKAGNSQP